MNDAPPRAAVTTEKDGMDRIDPLIAQIAGVDPGDIYGFALVLMPRDESRPLITCTNFEGRESVHYILGRAAEEWPQ